MARLITILILALCWQAQAQGTFHAYFVASTPNPEHSLFGSASLTLEGNTLSYRIEVTGPTLGGYGRGVNGQIDRKATITLNADGPRIPSGLLMAGYGDWNYDLIVRLPGEPPLPMDYYWAHDYFRGSFALSDADVSSLVAGEASLNIRYGAFASISGTLVAVPEPSILGLGMVGVAVLLLRRRKA